MIYFGLLLSLHDKYKHIRGLRKYAYTDVLMLCKINLLRLNLNTM